MKVSSVAYIVTRNEKWKTKVYYFTCQGDKEITDCIIRSTLLRKIYSQVTVWDENVKNKILEFDKP